MRVTDTIEALGYTRRGDEWIHEELGFRLSEPEALDGYTLAELTPLHERSTWRHQEPPGPPPHEPALAAALARNGFTWAGWLDAWEAASGELIPHTEILKLGAARLSELATARAAWLAENARRQRWGCVGMGGMLLWVAVGWLAGQWIWMGGMAVIGLISWKNRPLVRLPDAWRDLEGVDLEALMDAATAALPDGWKDLPEVTGVLSAGDGELYIPQLDRCVAAATLETLDRAMFEAFLTALAPT